MLKRAFLFAIILVAAIAAAASEFCNIEDPEFDDAEDSEFDDGSWRIVGGSDAEFTDAPYQAALRTDHNWQICGAAILNSRTVITAGHCVFEVPIEMINVVTGTLMLESGDQRYEASATIIHPGFNESGILNDIALVITKEPIVFSPTVQPIKLSTEPTGADVPVLSTGWGQTGSPGNMSKTLQKICLKTISYEDCKTKMTTQGAIHEYQVCTLTKKGQGTCYGDSGGPLAGETGLIGIVSWGKPCATGFPDVFSRVSYFADWINENTQE